MWHLRKVRRICHNDGNRAQRILSQTTEKSHHSSWDSVLRWALELTHFQKCPNCPTQLQFVRGTLPFIRHFMARPCRVDSQRQVFNTIEFLHNDIQTCIKFQIRDQSHASISSITPLMVRNSFTCLPAFDVIHFQRFPCGRSHTDSNDPHRPGTRTS